MIRFCTDALPKRLILCIWFGAMSLNYLLSSELSLLNVYFQQAILFHKGMRWIQLSLISDECLRICFVMSVYCVCVCVQYSTLRLHVLFSLCSTSSVYTPLHLQAESHRLLSVSVSLICSQVRLCGHPDPVWGQETFPWRTNCREDL